MQKIRWFLLILVIALALVVGLQNNDPTRFQLLFFGWTLPLSVLMLSTTVIGFLIGSVMTASMLRSRRSSTEKTSKKAAIESHGTDEPDPQPVQQPPPASPG